MSKYLIFVLRCSNQYLEQVSLQLGNTCFFPKVILSTSRRLYTSTYHHLSSPIHIHHLKYCSVETPGTFTIIIIIQFIIIIIIVVVVVVVTFTITIAIIMSYPTGILVYSYRLTSFSLCRYYVIIVSLLYHCHVMPCSYHYCILYHILSSCLPRGGNEEQVTHRAKASGCVPGLAATALRWQNFTNHLQHFLGRHGKTMLRRRGNATQSDSQLQIP